MFTNEKKRVRIPHEQHRRSRHFGEESPGFTGQGAG